MVQGGINDGGRGKFSDKYRNFHTIPLGSVAYIIGTIVIMTLIIIGNIY